MTKILVVGACAVYMMCDIAATALPPPALSASNVAVVMPKGTAIHFRTRSPLSSRTAQLLDRLELEVTEDVLIGGDVVIPRGSQAIGEVSRVAGKNTWGDAGSLAIQLVTLIADGRSIPITGTMQSRGAASTAGVIGAVVLLNPLMGFYVTGTSATLPVGSALTGVTATDMALGAVEMRPGMSTEWVANRRPFVGPAIFRGMPEQTLQAGTAIHLRSLSALNSKLMQPGDLFELEVVDDVLLNGEAIIPRGSPAVGEVLDVRTKAHWGRAGALQACLRSVRINGRVLELTGLLHAAGDSIGLGGVPTVGFGYSPFGYFVSGTSATIPGGTLLVGITKVDLKLPEFDPKIQQAEMVQPPAMRAAQSHQAYIARVSPYELAPAEMVLRSGTN